MRKFIKSSCKADRRAMPTPAVEYQLVFQRHVQAESESRGVNIGATNMKHSFVVLLSAVAVCVFVSATPALAVTTQGANGNGNGCMRACAAGPDRSCSRISRHVRPSLRRFAWADPPPRRRGYAPRSKLGCLWGLRRYNGVSCRRAGTELGARHLSSRTHGRWAPARENSDTYIFIALLIDTMTAVPQRGNMQAPR